MNTKVSVIVPVYNASPYLRQMLDSVRNQTLNEIEIICVDDGSTDGSYEILCEYAGLDNRIKVLQHLEESKGAAEARNMGLDAASGEYVSFLDADDFFEPEMLEKAFEKAEGTHAKIVLFDGWVYDSKIGIDYKVPWIMNLSNLPNSDIFSNHDNPGRLFLMNSGSAWNNLYKREWIVSEGIRFFSVHPDDQVFVSLAYSLADRITVLKERYVHYRKNTENSQVNNNMKNPEAGYEATLVLFHELENRGILDLHRVSLVNLALINASVYLDFMPTEELFDKLFYKLQRVVLPEIEIDRVKDKELLSCELAQKKNWLLSCSPEQYLLNQRARKDTAFSFGYIYSQMKRGSRVALYGAGAYGRWLYGEMSGLGIYKIVGWFDQNAKEIGYPIMEPSELISWDFDYILIAILSSQAYQSVYEMLIGQGIAKGKIIWIGERREG